MREGERLREGGREVLGRERGCEGGREVVMEGEEVVKKRRRVML